MRVQKYQTIPGVTLCIPGFENTQWIKLISFRFFRYIGLVQTDLYIHSNKIKKKIEFLSVVS